MIPLHINCTTPGNKTIVRKKCFGCHKNSANVVNDASGWGGMRKR